MDDVTLAAPYLALGFQGGAFDSSICQIQVDGYGILLFETEDEVNRYYDMTVGDDGPTQSNPYNGPVRIYALTCSDRGILMRENT